MTLSPVLFSLLPPLTGVLIPWNAHSGFHIWHFLYFLVMMHNNKDKEKRPFPILSVCISKVDIHLIFKVPTFTSIPSIHLERKKGCVWRHDVHLLPGHSHKLMNLSRGRKKWKQMLPWNVEKHFLLFVFSSLMCTCDVCPSIKPHILSVM